MEIENRIHEKVLNPFALPPETDARFNLLIAAILVISIILSSYLPYYILSGDETVDTLLPGNKSEQPEITSSEDIEKTGKDSLQDATRYLFPLIIFTIVIMLLIIFTSIIYKRHPFEIIKKQRLKLLNEADPKLRRISDEIRNLSGLYGIPVPEIYISSNFTAGSQAFGYAKRNMIRIDNGLRIIVSKNVQKFRCIILHEMGHMVNKDVSKMYIARAFWKTSLLLFALPTIILIVITFLSGIWNKFSDGINSENIKTILFSNIPITLTLLFAITGSFLILYLILTGLVRVREYYADWRAASVGGKESLSDLFKQESTSEGTVSFYRKYFGWHPA